MKNTFRNIAASILSLCIASPFAIRAEHHADNGMLIDNLNQVNFASDIFNQAIELTRLDEDALTELHELGYNMEDESIQLADDIIDYASNYLGRPYRYGAKGPKAFDCSGFTSYIFRQHGIELSPSSKAQATQGTKLEVDEIRPGDLLFFGGRSGGKSVGHVAMAVNVDDNGSIRFIHASVSKGITYNTYPDDAYYQKRFLGARRVIE